MAYTSVLQGSIIILVFAYIALGPYASIYEQAIDQIKGPVEIAFRSVKNAVYDIYLLATNPTEWYARQQVINARPEKPISFPKGLEVESVDATPPSVPGGQPFVMNFVVRHEGDYPARQIKVAVACNQWCSVPPSQEFDKKKFSLCRYERTYLGDDYYCAENCGTDKTLASDLLIDPCIKQCIDDGNTKKSVIFRSKRQGDAVTDFVSNACITDDRHEFERTYWPKDPKDQPAMQKGEAQIITIEPFVTKPFSGGEAETRIAKVYLNVSYDYSTTSQLFVSVLGPEERQRLINERKLEFKPVVATAKVSPAKLSINVGPQPLQAGKEATLLVSVSNDRDHSRIILPEGTPVIITLPLEIGSNLQCTGEGAKKYFVDAEGMRVPEDEAVAEQLVYRINADPKLGKIEILPFEFNTIFSFICRFTAKDLPGIKTGIVTATLPSYTFVHTIIKDVPVTTPVGILFDPYEQYCNACGNGIFTSCTDKVCHDISGLDKRGIGTCYYDPALDSASKYVGTPCRSCGESPKCEQFFTEEACVGTAAKLSEAFDRCRISCKWDPAGTAYVHSIPFKGKCLPAPALGPTISLKGELQERIMQAASEYKAAYLPAGVDAEIRAAGIADTFEEMVLKLAFIESGFRHCKDGTLGCISDKTYGSVLCSLPLSDKRASCGAMQIAVNIHSGWRTSTQDYGCNGKGAYDIDCNVKLGIGLLSENYRRYGTIGNPNPACQEEPYRTQYQKYRGWEAALRAYNGWGCPKDYPGGQLAATQFVENVRKVTIGYSSKGTTQKIKAQPPNIKVTHSPIKTQYLPSDVINLNAETPLAAGEFKEILVAFKDSKGKDVGSNVCASSPCIVGRPLPAGEYTYYAEITKADGSTERADALKDITVTQPVIYSKADLMGMGTRTGLRKEVLDAFEAMQQDAKLNIDSSGKPDPIELVLVSGYRSFSEQRTLWNDRFRSIGNAHPTWGILDIVLEARREEKNIMPGLSRLHWGTDMFISGLDKSLDYRDFDAGGKHEKLYNWLKQNAAKYGFCQPYDTPRPGSDVAPYFWSYKEVSKQLTQQHMSSVTADDIKGEFVQGESEITGSRFNLYHKDLISEINPDCLS